MDDAIDLFLRLRGRPPAPTRPQAAATAVAPPQLQPARPLLAPAAKDAAGAPPGPPPLPELWRPAAPVLPVLALSSLRFLQRSQLVSTLEDMWGIFLLERPALTYPAARPVARPMVALDVDIILDERTCVVVLSPDELVAADAPDRLLSFLLAAVAPAFTRCWLLADVGPCVTDLDGIDNDRPAPAMPVLQALARLAAVLPSLREVADLDVSVAGAWSTDEMAAWIRSAAHAAMEAAVARGTWTQAQWLQRDWLEPMESQVRRGAAN